MIALGGKTGKAFRFGGKDAKKIEVKKNGTWQTVWTAEPAYDYGDGHLNTVTGGYNDMYYYSSGAGEFRQWELGTTSYWSGNLHQGNTWRLGSAIFPRTLALPFAHGVSGTNTRSFTVDATNGDMSVYLYIHYGHSTKSVTVSDLKIKINGADKTLKQGVEAGLIKPIVLIWSADSSGNYYFPTALNLYDGGSAGNGRYPGVAVLFMLNKGNIMNGFSYTASAAGTNVDNDGSEAYATPIENFRMVVTLPQ